ncbi:unnamed protein product, partial [Discosporangium mesarthrocarpum]
CYGDVSQYWDSSTGEWVEEFTTLDGTSHPINMFYAQEIDGGMELWAKEIENWMAPDLYDQLAFRYVRLNLTCPSSPVQESCVVFEPRFTNWSPQMLGNSTGYRFQYPALPSIDMPEAQPNSPGDVLLLDGNNIVEKTEEVTETSCNGDQAEYLGEDGYWRNSWVGSDGNTYELDHVFYVSGRDLWVSTIQATWAPNLEEILINRTVRLEIWCSNDERAEWIAFTVGTHDTTC